MATGPQFETLIELPFKGQRNYLRLADLLPALDQLASNRFGPNAWVDSLTLRRPFHHAILASLEPNLEASGTFTIRIEDRQIPGWLIESPHPVPRRIPYDSTPIESAAETGPGFAGLCQPVPDFSSIDCIIALMHLVCSQVTRGVWMICQLNLQAPLTQSLPIEVRLRQSLAGRFVLFSLIQQNATIGAARVMLQIESSQEVPNVHSSQ